jgi:transcriptional regulator with XRE-family HTH domain
MDLTPLARRPPASPADPVPDDLKLAFGQNVLAARTKVGMTMADLAVKAGVSRFYISRIEANDANVTLDMVTRLAAVLLVPPRDLLKPLRPARKKR